MRIVHIIPAAFNYFDDIRDLAMAEVEAEVALGIEAEAFTVQYGSVTERISSNVQKVAPTRVFKGMVTGSAVVDALDTFDVVHVHCPILGMMREIIAFKRKNPQVALLVTYHRPVVVPDLFALYISWYTMWYLPQLLRVADALVTSPETGGIARAEPPRFEANLANPRQGVLDYFALYQQLVI